MKTTKGWYKATILQRFSANIIDLLLFIVPIIIIVLTTGWLRHFPGPIDQIVKFELGLYIVYFLYEVISIWKFGKTLGKLIAGVQVVSVNNQPVKLWQAIIRETIGKLISAQLFSLGYLWALWDKDRQTWHDKLARTYVVTQQPNDGKTHLGKPVIVFVILLFVSFLFAIIAIPFVIGGSQKDIRDAKRIADLNFLNKAIQTASEDGASLCSHAKPPCGGNSNILDANITKTDGSGWVKADLSKIITNPQLPVDPINSGNFKYHYCSDGKDWELIAKMDFKGGLPESQNDGGDDSTLYEVGSNLSMCSRSN